MLTLLLLQPRECETVLWIVRLSQMQALSCVSLVSGFDGETHRHISFKNIFSHLCSQHYLVTYQTRNTPVQWGWSTSRNGTVQRYNSYTSENEID